MLTSQDVRKLQIQIPRRKANPYPRVTEANVATESTNLSLPCTSPPPTTMQSLIVHAYPGHFSGMVAALPLISTGSKGRWKEVFPCPVVVIRATLGWLWLLPVTSDLTLAYHFSSIAN